MKSICYLIIILGLLFTSVSLSNGKDIVSAGVNSKGENVSVWFKPTYVKKYDEPDDLTTTKDPDNYSGLGKSFAEKVAKFWLSNCNSEKGIYSVKATVDENHKGYLITITGELQGPRGSDIVYRVLVDKSSKKFSCVIW